LRLGAFDIDLDEAHRPSRHGFVERDDWNGGRQIPETPRRSSDDDEAPACRGIPPVSVQSHPRFRIAIEEQAVRPHDVVAREAAGMVACHIIPGLCRTFA
jgi:hypothetical protein